MQIVTEQQKAEAELKIICSDVYHGGDTEHLRCWGAHQQDEEFAFTQQEFKAMDKKVKLLNVEDKYEVRGGERESNIFPSASTKISRVMSGEEELGSAVWGKLDATLVCDCQSWMAPWHKSGQWWGSVMFQQLLLFGVLVHSGPESNPFPNFPVNFTEPSKRPGGTRQRNNREQL